MSRRTRYASITGMRGDQVLPRLLGIAKFRREDCVRRAFGKQNEDGEDLVWASGASPRWV
ncbi:MAG: hypothetical protein K7J46_00435 [Bryobacter sp.]|nr:hypothetical protein [Bryobacter sp. CoA8 C33]